MRQILNGFSILAIVFILGATSMTVFAQKDSSPNMTVLGMRLNAPLSLPECPIIKVKDLGDTYDNLDIDITKMCFKRDLSQFKKGNKTKINLPLPPLPSSASVTLGIPPASRPKYIWFGEHVTVFIIDGKVAGVHFKTPGIKEPDNDLIADLKEKYGNPTKVTPKELQNAYGAKYSTVVMEWSLPGLLVIYDGHDKIYSVGESSIGSVSIITDTLNELMKKQESGKPGKIKL